MAEPLVDAHRIAVVIPALNEALRIRGVVQGALRECATVIVVEDGSTDGSHERIADLPVILLRHPRRMGKGASLRDGFAEALRRGFHAVLTMDGDGQHAADDLPRLLAAGNAMAPMLPLFDALALGDDAALLKAGPGRVLRVEIAHG